MINKLHTYFKTQVVGYFSDVRNIGMAVFAAIALLVTWSGINVVQSNYDLQKQISGMQQENEVKKLENENLKLQNQYLNTNEYLELAARRHFNKALPGEKLLVVPKSVALAHTIDFVLPKAEMPAAQQRNKPAGSGPWYERNFNSWLEFLLHRQSAAK